MSGAPYYDPVGPIVLSLPHASPPINCTGSDDPGALVGGGRVPRFALRTSPPPVGMSGGRGSSQDSTMGPGATKTHCSRFI